MAKWSVELASRPDLVATGPGRPDPALVAIDSVLEERNARRAGTIEGSAQGSKDGRAGGVGWVVAAGSAEEAAAIAGQIVREGLRLAGRDADDAIVDYLNVTRYKPELSVAR